MEGRYSLGEKVSLAARDALLSRLGGEEWPFDPLLDLVEVPPTADLLDVGAGDGRFLQTLRTRGHVARLVGLDPLPGSPEVARGEASDLPFADGSFDLVTLVRVLGHLPDPLTALAEARRVVRLGGRVVLAAHGGDHLRETWRRVLGRTPGVPGPEAVLREAITQAGWVASRPDARLPVTLTAGDVEVLVTASGAHDDVPQTAFPVRDTLHLALYVARF
ncbi:BioC family methyltransferase [Deinococcus aetherius]|uniref:BioC family methyltransferase n=2 Tax=Deinococcus aetherius TaxID=200252 RepID=A0ABN6RDP1_9DEIO|nr:BioC family methyltransferase [Deinococcus aetherius]